MTRNGSISILVLAIAAVVFPASAFGDYSTVNSITGSAPASEPAGYSSVNSLVGDEAASQAGAPTTQASSPHAILGADGQAQASPVATARTRGDEGFDWLDGAIGALVAAGLMLMTLTAARTVVRHRRATVESRA